MNVFLGFLVVATAALLAIAAMLLVRRRAPDGSYFNDGDRASGVFGVLATGFAVLLGLVVVLAFTSYDESRAGAETEALTLAQQYEVAHLLPPASGRRLAAELICYGRSIVRSVRNSATPHGFMASVWVPSCIRGHSWCTTDRP